METKADPAVRPGWFWLLWAGIGNAKTILTCSQGMRSGPRKGMEGPGPCSGSGEGSGAAAVSR